MKKFLLLTAVTVLAGPAAVASSSGEISLHKAAARLLNKEGVVEKSAMPCKLVFESDILGGKKSERFKLVNPSANESYAYFPVKGPNESGDVAKGPNGVWTIESRNPGSPDEGQKGRGETFTIAIGADSVSIEHGRTSVTCDIRE